MTFSKILSPRKSVHISILEQRCSGGSRPARLFVETSVCRLTDMDEYLFSKMMDRRLRCLSVALVDCVCVCGTVL